MGVGTLNLIGRIAPVFKANYAADTAYKKLDVVLYEYSLWLALQNTAGNAPPGIPENADLTQPIKNDYWQLYIPGAQVAGGESFVSKTDIAQAPTETDPGKLGISKPDGETITIDEDGTLHGASLDFVGTAAELKAAISEGNVKAGMTAFIRQGDIDGEGMLVEVTEGTGMSMIGKVEGGKFVPYASMGDKQKGVPLFVFDDKAAWQEEYDAGNVPDGSVIILLRDEEGDGSGTYVTVDGELSLESENPVQNKVITREFENVKAMRGSETEYGMVRLSRASDVTDSTGLAVPTSELNAALEGTVAHEISSLKDNFANKFYRYYKYGLSDAVESANGTYWVRAGYLNAGDSSSKMINLTDVLPAPFNDKSKCEIVSASCFDGTSWFHGAPITTFGKAELQVNVINNQYPQYLALTIVIMRIDV